MLDERPDHEGIWTAVVPNHHNVDKFLSENLPSFVPNVMCKGLCWESCSVIPTTPIEKRRVETASGHELYVRDDGTCSMLSDDHRCTVYSVRPLVCRIYGGAEGLSCPHDCVTFGNKYLSKTEAMALFRQAALAEGEHVVTITKGPGTSG